jgi:hypothetical protein
MLTWPCAGENGERKRGVGQGGQRLFKRLGGTGQRGKKGRGPCRPSRVEKEEGKGGCWRGDR